MLVALAESLKDLIDYIGGSQYIMSLINPLEFLTSVEENSVREAAIDSIKKILATVRVKDHEQHLKVMLNKMMSSDWFTSKIACICLSPYIYKSCTPPFQTEIIG